MNYNKDLSKDMDNHVVREAYPAKELHIDIAFVEIPFSQIERFDINMECNF